MRKVIQIAYSECVAVAPEMHNARMSKQSMSGLFALCDDGSMWAMCDPWERNDWDRVQDVPQDDLAPCAGE
jgi:hypothetical protein